MKVAIVHYWFVSMRGGEKVVEALCRLFPEADIITHVIDRDGVSDIIRRHKVRTTFISRLPRPRSMYQSYLPLMPHALEEMDMSGYDLVLSSEAGPAKGVIVPPGATHICYCHSPMRYLWDQYHVYKRNAGLVARASMSVLGPRLRQWDVTSAARVDRFIANSGHVQKRIAKYWRRESEVLHPPVAVQDFAPAERGADDDFYLWVGELVGYKKPEIVVEAFNRLGKKLVVIGGPDKAMRQLSAKAKGNIAFLGRAPFPVVKAHLARCKALIFPGEEDFGMVPVEAMASGRPVIAYAAGGALETVKDRETGLLFHRQDADGLVAAIEQFEAEGLDKLAPDALTAHAERFSEENFLRGMIANLSAQGIEIDTPLTRQLLEMAR